MRLNMLLILALIASYTSNAQAPIVTKSINAKDSLRIGNTTITSDGVRIYFNQKGYGRKLGFTMPNSSNSGVEIYSFSGVGGTIPAYGNTPSNGNLLMYNGTNWIATNPSISNLQAVASAGNKTSNQLWIRSLVIGDTTHTGISATNNNFAGGLVSTGGTIAASTHGAIAIGSSDVGNITANNMGAMARGVVGGSGSFILSSSWGTTAAGWAGTGGTITASANGATAYGNAGNLGVINASSAGGTAIGFSTDTSLIEAPGSANFSGGYAGNGSTISSKTGWGNIAYGWVGTNSARRNIKGLIESSGYGSLAVGSSAGGILRASGTGALAHGYAITNTDTRGIIQATTNGAFAGGLVSAGGGEITASGNGSFAHGRVQATAKIIASGVGSWAGGFALDSNITTGVSGTIEATDNGAFAYGFAQEGGRIRAIGHNGSFALGHAKGANSSIISSVAGSFAFGYSNNGGVIQADNIGSIAFGVSLESNSLILSNSAGSFVSGMSTDGGILNANGEGSAVFGKAMDSDSKINAVNEGAFAIGLAQDKGIIESYGGGSFAGGFAYNLGSNIRTDAYGSVSYGSVHDSSQLIAGGEGAVSFGVIQNKSKHHAIGYGAFITGYSSENSEKIANSDGTVVMGFTESSSLMQVNGTGSFIFGYAQSSTKFVNDGAGSLINAYMNDNGYIYNGGDGSFVHAGSPNANDTVINQGAYSFVIGLQSSYLKNEGQRAFVLGNNYINTENDVFAIGKDYKDLFKVDLANKTVRINSQAARATFHNGGSSAFASLTRDVDFNITADSLYTTYFINATANGAIGIPDPEENKDKIIIIRNLSDSYDVELVQEDYAGPGNDGVFYTAGASVTGYMITGGGRGVMLQSNGSHWVIFKYGDL